MTQHLYTSARSLAESIRTGAASSVDIVACASGAHPGERRALQRDGLALRRGGDGGGQALRRGGQARPAAGAAARRPYDREGAVLGQGQAQQHQLEAAEGLRRDRRRGGRRAPPTERRDPPRADQRPAGLDRLPGGRRSLPRGQKNRGTRPARQGAARAGARRRSPRASRRSSLAPTSAARSASPRGSAGSTG